MNSEQDRETIQLAELKTKIGGTLNFKKFATLCMKITHAQNLQ